MSKEENLIIQEVILGTPSKLLQEQSFIDLKKNYGKEASSRGRGSGLDGQLPKGG